MNFSLRLLFVCLALVGFAVTSSAQMSKKRGTMKFRHPNGQLAAKGKVKHHKKQGTWKFWDDKGNLHSTAVYLNDTANGAYTEYSTAGTVVILGNYCMNQKCGKWKLFDDTGRQIADQNYSNGQFDGVQQYWYPSGKLREYVILENGLLKYRKGWYPSGKVCVIQTYKDGLPDGTWRLYGEPQHELDTFPISTLEYSNGMLNGWHHGYQQGKLIEKFHYANDVKDGGWYRWQADGKKISEEWFTNGRLQSGKYYVNGIIARTVQFENEKKHGPETDFNRYGNPVKVTWWTLGVKDSAFIYHTNGKKSSAQYYTMDNAGVKSSYTEWDSAGVKLISGIYLNDKKQGEWITWYADGGKRSVTNYTNGVVQGVFTKWYPNGKKMIEMNILPDGTSISIRAWNEKGKQLKEGSREYNEIVEGNKPGDVYSDPSEHHRKIIDRRIEEVEIDNSEQFVTEVWSPDVERELPRDTSDVFTFCEIMPEFPGGEEARKKFIVENLVDPRTIGHHEHREGTVYVEYIVEKDGRVTNVKVIKSIPNSPDLDKAAIDVVNKFPVHTPAKHSGETVRCRVIVPVRFVLQ